MCRIQHLQGELLTAAGIVTLVQVQHGPKRFERVPRNVHLELAPLSLSRKGERAHGGRREELADVESAWIIRSLDAWQRLDRIYIVFAKSLSFPGVAEETRCSTARARQADVGGNQKHPSAKV